MWEKSSPNRSRYSSSPLVSKDGCVGVALAGRWQSSSLSTNASPMSLSLFNEKPSSSPMVSIPMVSSPMVGGSRPISTRSVGHGFPSTGVWVPLSNENPALLSPAFTRPISCRPLGLNGSPFAGVWVALSTKQMAGSTFTFSLSRRTGLAFAESMAMGPMSVLTAATAICAESAAFSASPDAAKAVPVFRRDADASSPDECAFLFFSLPDAWYSSRSRASHIEHV
mmetsp:Transcript_1271/g.2791  ORF Transcript_1271/g.2791 Transcript_1271/m.2791 type:complete len:225 (-) Transcript_1271:438-1112(-)